jgi:hypothetical protein
MLEILEKHQNIDLVQLVALYKMLCLSVDHKLPINVYQVSKMQHKQNNLH